VAQDRRDTLFRTIENVARAACHDASICRNTCPDGSTAMPPRFTCDRVE